MHAGARQNGRVKSIMKQKDEDVSTGDIEEDSFADDDQSSVSSHNGSDGASNSTPTRVAKKPTALQIAGRETKYVLCSKTMAYLVLLLSSIACGVVTFYYIEDEEEDSFEQDVRVMFPWVTANLLKSPEIGVFCCHDFHRLSHCDLLKLSFLCPSATCSFACTLAM